MRVFFLQEKTAFSLNWSKSHTGCSRKKNPIFCSRKKKPYSQEKNRNLKQGFFLLDHPVFRGNEQSGSEIESREVAKKTPPKRDFFIRLKKWRPPERTHPTCCAYFSSFRPHPKRNKKKGKFGGSGILVPSITKQTFRLRQSSPIPPTSLFSFLLWVKRRGKENKYFFYRKTKGVANKQKKDIFWGGLLERCPTTEKKNLFFLHGFRSTSHSDLATFKNGYLGGGFAE